jgi:hypothetical protein
MRHEYDIPRRSSARACAGDTEEPGARRWSSPDGLTRSNRARVKMLRERATRAGVDRPPGLENLWGPRAVRPAPERVQAARFAHHEHPFRAMVSGRSGPS